MRERQKFTLALLVRRPCRLQDIIKLLVESGANLNASDGTGWSPLTTAVVSGKLKIVSLLISYNLDVNVTTEKGLLSPIHLAGYHKHQDIMKLLIKSGANLNALDGAGYSPLTSAVYHGNLEIVSLLIDYNLDINKADGNGWSPILIAASKGWNDIFSFLIKRGSDINSKEPNGWSTLNMCISRGEFKMVKLLIDSGVDVNLPNKIGSTPLAYAVNNGKMEIQYDIASLLIERGASTNIKLRSGRSLLHMAADGGYYYMIQLLLANGAKIGTKDRNGNSPTEAIMKLEKIDKFKTLLLHQTLFK